MELVRNKRDLAATPNVETNETPCWVSVAYVVSCLVIAVSLAAIAILFSYIGYASFAVGAGGVIVGGALLTFVICTAMRKTPPPSPDLASPPTVTTETRGAVETQNREQDLQQIEIDIKELQRVNKEFQNDIRSNLPSADPIVTIENFAKNSPSSEPTKFLEETRALIELPLTSGKVKVTDLRKIGQGSTSSVYSFSGKENLDWVLKMTHNPNFSLKHQYLVGIRFDHPNIMKTDPAMKPTEQQYLILEKIRGMGLKDNLKFKPNFVQSMKLVEQLIDGAIHMIERGVLPWDLMSLKNLMVDEAGNLKFIGFRYYFFFKDETGFKQEICNFRKTETWCAFRGSLGDVLSVAMQILEPHKEKLKATPLFYNMLYDRSIWNPGERPALKFFPSLLDGSTCSPDASPEEKQTSLLTFLRQLKLACTQAQLLNDHLGSS